MTERSGDTGNSGGGPDVQEPMAERRLAHERLSTGGARTLGACLRDASVARRPRLARHHRRR